MASAGINWKIVSCNHVQGVRRGRGGGEDLGGVREKRPHVDFVGARPEAQHHDGAHHCEECNHVHAASAERAH
eukprot:3586753-Pyramimonas_sp.AAC.3